MYIRQWYRHAYFNIRNALHSWPTNVTNWCWQSPWVAPQCTSDGDGHSADRMLLWKCKPGCVWLGTPRKYPDTHTAQLPSLLVDHTVFVNARHWRRKNNPNYSLKFREVYISCFTTNSRLTNVLSSKIFLSNSGLWYIDFIQIFQLHLPYRCNLSL